jgi:hypothetical protein
VRPVLLKIACNVATVLASVNLSAQTSEIAELRVLYYRASHENKAANEFYDKLQSIDETQPVRLGYKGMASFMLAYHSRNPLSKLKYFIEGKGSLEKAIEHAPASPELRYLRFTVQTNAPAFLNYGRNIDEDKKILLAALVSPTQDGIDRDLRQRMLDYMLESKYCSDRDKQLLFQVELTDKEEARR